MDLRLCLFTLCFLFNVIFVVSRPMIHGVSMSEVFIGIVGGMGGQRAGSYLGHIHLRRDT